MPASTSCLETQDRSVRQQAGQGAAEGHAQDAESLRQVWTQCCCANFLFGIARCLPTPLSAAAGRGNERSTLRRPPTPDWQPAAARRTGSRAGLFSWGGWRPQRRPCARSRPAISTAAAQALTAGTAMSWISDSVISTHRQLGHDVRQAFLVRAWLRFRPCAPARHRRGRPATTPTPRRAFFSVRNAYRA